MPVVGSALADLADHAAVGAADLYDQADADREGFWAEQGRRLHWIKPYTKVKDVDYTGDVQLFVATADKSDPSALAQAWRAFVTGDVSEVFVDTYHLGMADPDSLAVIGPELRRALDAADTAFPDDRPTDR